MGVRRPVVVNWGKSYAPARGSVEFIRVAIEPSFHARDFTIYLGDVSQLEGLWSDRPYELTFANGGTSSVENIIASIRGTTIHCVAAEVVVRGDTSPGEDIPANAAFRYQAHCALGRPSEHFVPSRGGGGQSINAVGQIYMPLPAYSTHAWLDGLSGDLTNATVTQIQRTYGVDTVAVSAVPAGVYAEPRALGWRANYLLLDVGAPPSSPISWCMMSKVVR